MLKNIKIKNFYSIGEEQEISLEITRKDMLDDSARQIDADNFMNLVSCVIGSNASGKTTALKAIGFLFWFINEPYTSLKNETKIPVNQHMLRQNEPTKLEVEFYNKEVLYRYLIEFNQNEVLHERLDKRNERMVNVFESSRESNNIFFKTNHFKVNDADEARFKERRNISLLSCLIDTGYLPEISFFKNFKSNVTKFGTASFAPLNINFFNVSAEMRKNVYLCQEILQFSKDKKFSLPIFEESNGTQHNIYLLFEILPILKEGGLVVLDEIESGLHPYVAKKIISLFADKKTNPNNAQLIFSTHQHPLLNDRTKTQIFIAEKEASETEIYRLDDVEGVRNDENFFHKYLAGAYGGIPNVNWL